MNRICNFWNNKELDNLEMLWEVDKDIPNNLYRCSCGNVVPDNKNLEYAQPYPYRVNKSNMFWFYPFYTDEMFMYPTSYTIIFEV